MIFHIMVPYLFFKKALLYVTEQYNSEKDGTQRRVSVEDLKALAGS